MTIAMPENKLGRKSFGASPEATEHNMDFMVQVNQEHLALI